MKKALLFFTILLGAFSFSICSAIEERHNDILTESDVAATINVDFINDLGFCSEYSNQWHYEVYGNEYPSTSNALANAQGGSGAKGTTTFPIAFWSAYRGNFWYAAGCDDDITGYVRFYYNGTGTLINLSNYSDDDPGQDPNFNFLSYNPVLCQNNSAFSGTAAGIIEIPATSTYHIYKITIEFRDLATINPVNIYASTTFPTIGPGESYEFNLPYELASDTTYFVQYILNGYNKPDPLIMGTEFIEFIPVPYINSSGQLDLSCFTSIGEATSTPPIERLWGIPIESDLEDCSGKTFTEQMLCEIRNTMISVILPDEEHMNSFLARKADIESKFPYNYVNESIYCLNLFLDGMQQTTTETSTFDTWNVGGTFLADISYSIGQNTTMQLIRQILAALLIVAFAVWIIKHPLREFWHK